MSEIPWPADQPHPGDDPRTVVELISDALCADRNDDSRFDAVAALHWRGTREVFDEAARLCRSACAVERELGVQILGQLGCPERTFPEDSLGVILGLLRSEEDPGVISSILIATSFYQIGTGVPEIIELALGFEGHGDPEVRYGVAFTLQTRDDPRAIAALIRLTGDPEPDVRDWATFAIGTQIERDTPEIRQALVDRLEDEDLDTRSEAMVGLARRGDVRVLPALRRALAGDCVGRQPIEAAELLCDPSLYPALIAMRSRWHDDPRALEDAILACTPS